MIPQKLKRLIIIDDSENMRSIFEIALESTFELFICSSSEHALEKIRLFKPEAILVDPLSVDVSFHSLDELQAIPQIACSVYKPSPVVAVHFTAYIQKPFDPIQLPILIAAAIEG